MNLPFKIASQYLFTDKFFSKKGFITNAILSALALILLTIDVRYGVPILIIQLLPFQFAKNTKSDFIIKGSVALLLLVAAYLELPSYVQILRVAIIGLSLFGLVQHFFKYKKLSIRNLIFLGLTIFLLFNSYWIGVLFYILSLFIHQLFKGKKNAVHVISRISVLGISVGTTALILVLSVFNGFEDLIISLFDAFNPDVKVTIAEGKTFRADSSQIAELVALDEIVAVSQTIEEVAFFEYEGSQNFGIVKGVDKHFKTVSNVDSNLIRGMYGLKRDEVFYAVLGSGMEYKLAVNVENRLNTLNIYMPKRQKTPTLANAFKKRFVYPLGTFAIQQEFDDQFVLVDLGFARDLLSYEDEVSALEIKLQNNANESKIIAKIKSIMGEEYEVRNRYQQNEAFFKLMNVEKWIGFAVLSFTLLLVSFNMVGALWMLVLEKKKDIAILKSMGTLEGRIQKIFLYKGLLLALIGGFVGVYIALIFYFFQQQFSIIQLAGSANLLVDAYPISLKWLDFMLVFLTVVFIGIFAAWLPSIRAKKVSPMIRES
jgi:lipoprotein-releasing system permease protein